MIDFEGGSGVAAARSAEGLSEELEHPTRKMEQSANSVFRFTSIL